MRGKHTRRFAKNRQKILLGAGIFLTVFLVLNAAVFVLYRGRAYPHSTILGQQVAGLNAAKIQQKLEASNPLPEKLTLVHGAQKTEVKTSSLGVSLSLDKIRSSVNAGRSWLPIADLLTHHDLPAPIAIDSSKLQQTASKFKTIFYEAPSPAHISWSGKSYEISQPSAGSELDMNKLPENITESLTAFRQSVAVPLALVPAKDKNITDTTKALQAVQQQLDIVATYTYDYQGKKITASQQDKAAWFVQNDDEFKLSEDAIRTYVTVTGKKMFGRTPANLEAAVASTLQSAESGKNVSVALAKFSKTVTYHYCVALRGVSSNYLAGFEQTIANVYADSRGWNLDGQVIFQRVNNDCDYTVWLTAPSQMATFGAICDSYWDCEAGVNVVANFDRWENATPAWNAAHTGDSLEEYRALIINHETGHQLGFGHSHCAVPGGLSPVMDQQSINLYGCKFNSWPLASEQQALRNILGL